MMRNEDKNKGDAMKYVYVINTQNLEEYGENFHKFKGGSTYVVHTELNKEIFEKDYYGPGKHDYYYSPKVTKASAAAEVMKHVNAYNGLEGSFDYITDIDQMTLETYETDPVLYADWEGPFEKLILDRVDRVGGAYV